MFSRIFIDRPRLAFVCSIVLVLSGIICIRKLFTGRSEEAAMIKKARRAAR